MMQAELYESESFDEAIRGCQYVIHTAAHVCLFADKGKVRQPSPPPFCST